MNTESDDKSNDAIAQLVRMAGTRPEIPKEVEARVYAQVHEEWQQSSGRKSRLRWVLPAAVAATVMLAFNLAQKPAPVSTVPAGTVARVVAADNELAVGDVVNIGDSIATPDDGGMSILLASGASVRLGEQSAIRVDGKNEFTLLSGSVYADSGAWSAAGSKVTFDTPYGRVTDVGTQFLVDVTSQSLGVAVREGRVDIATSTQSLSTAAGEQLTLSMAGETTVSPVAVDDSIFAWAIDLAPAYDIENRTLLDFLKWVSRETGKELVFADDDLRMAAMGTVLHGSVSTSRQMMQRRQFSPRPAFATESRHGKSSFTARRYPGRRRS